MGDWLTKQSMPADAFLMLGDGSGTKKIYRAYGMQSSILGSWSPATLLFYAKNIFSGTRLEKTQVKEDLHQLGGDFIVGQDGKLLLSHPSTSPIDRVAVSDIMDCIRKAVCVSVGVSDECSRTDCSAHAHGHTNRADSEVVGSEPNEDDAEDGECST